MKRKNSSGEGPTSKEFMSPSFNRRQQLLEGQDFSSRGRFVHTSYSYDRSHMAEVAGATSAECVAVCCCCPCAMVDLVVLAVYKLPAGIYKKALRKKRRRRMSKNGGDLRPLDHICGCDEPELVAVVNALHCDEDIIALEEEMWEKFCSSGFFRSPSQKSDVIYG